METNNRRLQVKLFLCISYFLLRVDYDMTRNSRMLRDTGRHVELNQMRIP
jgi:hypothetical protein